MKVNVDCGQVIPSAYRDLAVTNELGKTVPMSFDCF